MLKNFWKDESAVAIINIYSILSMFVMGVSYLILQDIKDMIVPLYATLSPMAGYLNDSDSQGGLDFLLFLFAFFIAFFVIGLIYWMVQISQKPESPF